MNKSGVKTATCLGSDAIRRGNKKKNRDPHSKAKNKIFNNKPNRTLLVTCIKKWAEKPPSASGLLQKSSVEKKSNM